MIAPSHRRKKTRVRGIAMVLVATMLVVSLIPNAAVAVAMDIRQFTADLPPNTIAPPSPRAGFLGEVVAEAHRRAGLTFRPEFLPWTRAQAMTERTPGSLIFGIGRTPEREGRYRWIVELLVQRSSFIRSGDVPQVNSVDEARALGSIGVQNGTNRLEYLTALGFPNLDTTPSEEMNLRKLLAGRIDAMFAVNDRVVFLGEKLAMVDRIVLGRTILEEHIWLAAHPAFPEDLAARLAEAIAAIKADGTFAKVRAAYISKESIAFR